MVNAPYADIRVKSQRPFFTCEFVPDFEVLSALLPPDAAG
jgi:hypothetical protein